jgi:hypothetical protein
MSWGKCEQGFRRMAARNKPAGIRSLVYGIGKGKAGIEGLGVSDLLMPTEFHLSRVLAACPPKMWLATGPGSLNPPPYRR